MSSTHGATAPNYDIGIVGSYDTIWHTLDEGITNIIITSTTGTIDQDKWDEVSPGVVTITFYANNSYGHIGSNFVQITKSAPQPPIDEYSIVALVGITVVISGILARKKLKK
jgi:hypothetical protein